MNRKRIALYVVLSVLLVLPAVSFPSGKDTPQTPRPIELQDIATWKSIRGASLSDDGSWFGYRLTPGEGDSEIILRSTSGDKELRFNGGEVPSPGGGGRGGFGPGGPSSDIEFSADSRWVVFTVHPTAREAKRLRTQRKPLQSKVVLVELATEKKGEFERIKGSAFSGENPNWLALHRYPAENQGRGSNRWTGSDLILRELSTGADLNIGNVSEFAFNKPGTWLAWTVDAQEKSGNGLQARDMSNGAVGALDSGKAEYRRLTWTENGRALAALKGVEEKGFEDKFYAVLGFKDFGSGSPQRAAYDPKSDNGFPAGMTVSPNRNPQWSADLSGIFFGIHEARKKKDGDKESEGGEGEASRDASPPEGAANRPNEADNDRPDLVIWHWQDDRLQSQQQVEETRDKNFSYLCLYRVADNKFLRLADDTLRQVSAEPEHRFAVGLDNSAYQLMGSLDGQRYQDVYVVDLQTGTRRLAVKKSRWYFGPSPQGTHFLYYDDGHYFTYDMAAGKSANITAQVPVSFVDVEDDHNVVKPPIRPVGWTASGDSVLLSDDWDVWNVSTAGKGVNLTVNGRKEQIRYQNRIRLTREEKGIHLSGSVYFSAQAEWTKKGGLARIDGGKPGARMLLWDDALFSGLMKAKSADTFLYTRETYEVYPNYNVAGADLQGGRQITDANAHQKDFHWSSGSKLIDFTSDKGDKLQAALFLPANYEPGKSYPTVVYIYEKLTQGLNRYYTPSSNGFNKSVYTSHGYAVLMPDIVYKVNDPGMSAVWCVVPAVKAAVATGIVDAARVGIHGHSWGGYQTSFLVTQTDIFRAAVAGAPLTNMISMYSSIYWNTGSTNQPIFESSQGRFTGGYWDVPEAYTRNSPVYYAANVKTPLIILHNDKDGAVDFNQGIEYFNTLRRLRKPVIMLQYKGENHGLRKPANQKDYTVRMKEFFDHHLKGAGQPPWLAEGIDHLELKDHIDDRLEMIKPKEEEGKEKGEDKEKPAAASGARQRPAPGRPPVYLY